MRYLRRYISPNGLGAHALTDSKMSAHYMTHKQRLCDHLLRVARAIAHANGIVAPLLLATQGVDHLSLLHEARKHTLLEIKWRTA
jgi:ABC-type uncharacterized transport system ATPase subunit